MTTIVIVGVQMQDSSKSQHWLAPESQMKKEEGSIRISHVCSFSSVGISICERLYQTGYYCFIKISQALKFLETHAAIRR